MHFAINTHSLRYLAAEYVALHDGGGRAGAMFGSEGEARSLISTSVAASAPSDGVDVVLGDLHLVQRIIDTAYRI